MPAEESPGEFKLKTRDTFQTNVGPAHHRLSQTWLGYDFVQSRHKSNYNSASH